MTTKTANSGFRAVAEACEAAIFFAIRRFLAISATKEPLQAEKNFSSGGGMVDAADLKSADFTVVRVRVPSRVGFAGGVGVLAGCLLRRFAKKAVSSARNSFHIVDK